jgi:hypothetical protein
MIVGIGFLGMVAGNITTFFVSKLSTTEPKKAKSIVDEQIEYIKRKLDSIADLNQEEIGFLNQMIMQVREMKVKSKEG